MDTTIVTMKCLWTIFLDSCLFVFLGIFEQSKLLQVSIDGTEIVNGNTKRRRKHIGRVGLSNVIVTIQNKARTLHYQEV